MTEPAAPHGTAAPRERVLVRAPNWVGDVVLSLPALRDVRRAFPDARLEVLARSWVAGLCRAVPGIDAVGERREHAADVASVRGRFDLGVILPNSFGTALVLWRAGIKERWGYAPAGRGPLLTRACPVPARVRGHSQVYYYRAMLEGLGLAVAGEPDASLACPEDSYCAACSFKLRTLMRRSLGQESEYMASEFSISASNTRSRD